MASSDQFMLVKQLVKAWRLFASKEGISPADAYLSTLHLAEVVGNSLVDLQRMADFHQPPEALPDRHKYAGFISKWVAKVRPIQFPSTKPMNLTNMALLDLNARFSVYAFSAFLRHGVPPQLASHLKYWFGFREEKGETLSMIAFCSEELGRSFEANATRA